VDVLLDPADVPDPRKTLDRDDLKPAIEETADPFPRARVAPLVDLVQQSGAIFPLRASLLARPRGTERSRQVVQLVGDRVEAGVDADPQGAVRQPVHGSSRPALRPNGLGHDRTVGRARVITVS
jgi:hypothetical protein